MLAQARSRRTSYADLDALLVAIGEHHVSARVDRPAGRPRLPRRRRRGAAAGHRRCGRAAPQRRPTKVGVHVEGLDDVLVRLSRCCTPVPGDEIIGFVTRGRGVSVHRADCANAVSLMSDQAARLIEVEWDGERRKARVPRRRRGRRRSTARSCCATWPTRCQRPPRQHRRLQHRTPAPTASPRCASSSSSPTPATSTPCCARSRRIDAVYDAYRLVPGGGEDYLEEGPGRRSITTQNVYLQRSSRRYVVSS